MCCGVCATNFAVARHELAEVLAMSKKLSYGEAISCEGVTLCTSPVVYVGCFETQQREHEALCNTAEAEIQNGVALLIETLPPTCHLNPNRAAIEDLCINLHLDPSYAARPMSRSNETCPKAISLNWPHAAPSTGRCGGGQSGWTPGTCAAAARTSAAMCRAPA